MTIAFEISWRLRKGQTEAFEPELFAILQEIEASGSLQMAARTLDLSYRYAWGLMRKWAQLLGKPLAHLERGRGARLTSLGEKILWGQRRINARMTPELESLAAELNSEIGAIVHAREQALLRIYASHGLALGILRDLVHAEAQVKLQLQFRGSLDSLRLYRNGKCELAGFHLPEGALGRHLIPRFERYLDTDSDVLIHVVRREQGIMTAVGNPKKIRGVKDLARRDVRFINRQPGAGTRLISDALFEEGGIDTRRVRGYGNEEFTHMAVAAMVASGAADAGFGIKAAAAQFGLGFIPVAHENYWFAVDHELSTTAPLKALIGVLRGRDYRRKVAALQGYDGANAGDIVKVAQLAPAS